MHSTISGLILKHFTWCFMFIFILPVALGTLLLGIRHLTEVGNPVKTRLDVGM